MLQQELNVLGEKSRANGIAESAFHACNLPAALQLTSRPLARDADSTAQLLDDKYRDDDYYKRKYRDDDYMYYKCEYWDGDYYKRDYTLYSRGTTITIVSLICYVCVCSGSRWNQCRLSFSQMDTMLHSRVFIYPEMLPKIAFRPKDSHFKTIFTKSEDQ